jgi:uncharacterized protein YbjT (DUF2867 family)
MDQTILVIGGTGMLGAPVVRRLRADGYQVRLLSRNPAKAKETFGDGYEVVPGDVERPETLEAALAGCEGVHITLSGGPRPADSERIEFQGTAHVARAAARCGVRRLTYISGASVCAARTWFYWARTKFAAEAAIRDSGVAYTIFRPSWFLESLPWFVKGARAVLIGKQKAPLHWLAVADYAAMVSRAYRTPAAANKTLYIYGPETMAMGEALRLYCSIVHPRFRVYATPTWLVTLAALATRDANLRDGARLMRYFQDVTETNDPTEANALLGAPTTTIRQWCEAQRQLKPVATN